MRVFGDDRRWALLLLWWGASGGAYPECRDGDLSGHAMFDLELLAVFAPSLAGFHVSRASGMAASNATRRKRARPRKGWFKLPKTVVTLNH